MRDGEGCNPCRGRSGAPTPSPVNPSPECRGGCRVRRDGQHNDPDDAVSQDRQNLVSKQLAEAEETAKRQLGCWSYDPFNSANAADCTFQVPPSEPVDLCLFISRVFSISSQEREDLVEKQLEEAADRQLYGRLFMPVLTEIKYKSAACSFRPDEGILDASHSDGALEVEANGEEYSTGPTPIGDEMLIYDITDTLEEQPPHKKAYLDPRDCRLIAYIGQHTAGARALEPTSACFKFCLDAEPFQLILQYRSTSTIIHSIEDLNKSQWRGWAAVVSGVISFGYSQYSKQER